MFYKSSLSAPSDYDIIVLGGGFTGCAAALAAARSGFSVLILEASGFLGGAASNCLIYPFMPNKTRLKQSDGSSIQHNLSRGIFQEIFNALETRGGFRDESLKVILDDLIYEAGVKVLFHATLCDVEKSNNHINALSVVTKSGIYRFTGRIFIDATGDADLCAFAGIPTRLGRDTDHLCQPMTLCFRVINVDKKVFYENYPYAQEMFKKFQAEGKITNPRENILSMKFPADGVVHFNTTRVVKMNPVDPFAVSEAERLARKQVVELMDFFREIHMPGMENAVLMNTAPSIGVRESRMLDGAYVLTQKDLVGCVKFDDAIAAGNYDIDIHNPEGSGTSHYYFPEGTWYTIPYRCLIPKDSDCDNLLVGGRCISVTHEAQASIRIMPICCTTGEAAGVAAGVCLQNCTSVSKVDIKQVQAILTKRGAYIGY